MNKAVKQFFKENTCVLVNDKISWYPKGTMFTLSNDIKRIKHIPFDEEQVEAIDQLVAEQVGKKEAVAKIQGFNLAVELCSLALQAMQINPERGIAIMKETLQKLQSGEQGEDKIKGEGK